MGVLKGIAYLIGAVAVLTALGLAGLFIIVAGLVVGILLDVTGATLFTAAAMKAYFAKEK